MGDEKGKIELKAPNIFSWKLGNKNQNGEGISNGFSHPDYLGYFNFCIKPVAKKTNLGILWLYNDTWWFAKKLNLHLVFRYYSETKEVTVKNVKSAAGPLAFFAEYNLGEIRTNDLFEITCTFLRTRTLSKTAELDEGNEKKEKEECSDEQENLSRKGKSGKETRNRGPTEVVKTRGVAALIGNLKNIFLSEECSDVILKVGNQKYPAHKAIIGAWSPIFKAMIKHDMKMKNNGEVDIKDCDPYIFRDFLFYLYTGRLDNITNENVFELYHLSDKYDVKELRMDCVDFIINNLTIERICDAITIAFKHCERDLLTRVTSFFIDNAKEIIITENWQKFQKDYPADANELVVKTLNTK